MRRLNRLGIQARLSRNTALIDLAAQLPATVLFDLLNLHAGTATAWNDIAGNTCPGYAAEMSSRMATPDAQRGLGVCHPAGIGSGERFHCDVAGDGGPGRQAGQPIGMKVRVGGQVGDLHVQEVVVVAGDVVAEHHLG